MPSTYSINFNVPNANPFIPPQAQTPIPMTAIPMPFNGYPLYAPYQPDIIKKYDIKISTGDLGSINHIYQDMLPKNTTIYDRYTTIKERLNIANYYNTIFAKYYDTTNQENIKSGNSNNISQYNLSDLLGYFKINKLNPYHSYLNDNGIESFPKLPVNFIMFSCCYPIKYNTNNTISCTDDSLRSNLRIYRITTTKHYNDFIIDEVMYYNKIDEIVKKSKIPNFVMRYGMFQTKCKVDFKKINELIISNDSKVIREVEYIIKSDKESLQDNNHNCFLILSESINYNILDWCSKIYIKYQENQI